MINRATFFTLFICLFGFGTLFAQSGVSLEAEIQNAERAVSRQGATAVEKHDALVRLARLNQLSGNIESAARNWLDAAGAIPGRVDDDALLSCAYCLAAMGEWDRAITALEPLLSKSTRARFLDTSIKAIKTGDLSALGALADNSEYSEMKTEIIFILWKITRGNSSERWRQRLVNEFPQTPEGRLAAGADSSAVVIRTSPFWLFIGGLDSLALVENSPPPRTSQTRESAPSAAQPVAPSVSQPVAAQTPTAQNTPIAPAQNTHPPAASSAKLQTGIFSQQANAQAQVTALRQAGFSPSIEERTVNGNGMWAVTVSAGQDANATVAALRTAGFDSFLIRNSQ
ncbi:MAG: SPOR domain-containing protein [Treponema sp.]|jgi:cell division septation protein DedD|nr:SPOR domain-containing protein [Treponema sp.]